MILFTFPRYPAQALLETTTGCMTHALLKKTSDPVSSPAQALLKKETCPVVSCSQCSGTVKKPGCPAHALLKETCDPVHFPLVSCSGTVNKNNRIYNTRTVNKNV